MGLTAEKTVVAVAKNLGDFQTSTVKTCFHGLACSSEGLESWDWRPNKTVVAVAKNLGDFHTDLHRENMFPWTCLQFERFGVMGLTAAKTVDAVAKNLCDFHTDFYREKMFPWTCLQFGRSLSQVRCGFIDAP